VELGDGTVLIVESRERRLVLVDFSRGIARDIGRTGSGPGEFRLVSQAIARPDGGAWVVDFGLRRLLPVRRDGSFENPIPFPVSIQLRGADAAGLLYGEGFLPRAAQRPDSMWILRWNPAGSRVDTLLKYNALVSASVIPAGGTFKPFAPVDAWDVLPDGDLIVIEAEQYRLNAWRDGRRVRSASIPWTPLRVTEADRDAYRQRHESQRPMSIGQPGASSAPRPRPDVEFPSTFPPFGGEGLGGRYTTVSPTGQLWVKRLGAVTDSVPRYDVVDGTTGKLLMRVELPLRSHLVGLGRNAVYVIQRDADDLQFLQRHAVPDPT
jgi:hypothetical protein